MADGVFTRMFFVGRSTATKLGNSTIGDLAQLTPDQLLLSRTFGVMA